MNSEEIIEINLTILNEDSSNIIVNKNIKRRIAALCLELMQKSTLDKKSIFETAYNLSIFYGFDYLDELNDILGDIYFLASDFNPDINKWKQIEKQLKRYLN